MALFSLAISAFKNGLNLLISSGFLLISLCSAALMFLVLMDRIKKLGFVGKWLGVADGQAWVEMYPEEKASLTGNDPKSIHGIEISEEMMAIRREL